jgi:hypothetical protein
LVAPNGRNKTIHQKGWDRGKLSLFTVQLSYVIFGCAFGAASLKDARSATEHDK